MANLLLLLLFFSHKLLQYFFYVSVNHFLTNLTDFQDHNGLRYKYFKEYSNVQ